MTGSDPKADLRRYLQSARDALLWKLDGLSLVLTSSKNVTMRRIAFPQDDEQTIIRPDHLFFAGVLYKRRP